MDGADIQARERHAEIPTDRGGVQPRPMCEGFETDQVLREEEPGEGQEEGDRRDCTETPCHNLLDAPDEGALSRSRIQPRLSSCTYKCDIGIGADP